MILSKIMYIYLQCLFCNGVGVDGNFAYTDILNRTVLLVHRYFLYRIKCRIRTVDDPDQTARLITTMCLSLVYLSHILSENSIFGIKMGVFGVCDEKLWSVCVGSRVCHGYDPSRVMLSLELSKHLIFSSVPLTIPSKSIEFRRWTCVPK